MKNRRRGFLLYLAFLITTILFLLVISGQDISRFMLDSSRSAALDVVGFHSADGGLEQGLARLRTSFTPFTQDYSFKLATFREVHVRVSAVTGKHGTMDLQVIARILDGGREVAVRRLARQGIRNTPARDGLGRFVEVL